MTKNLLLVSNYPSNEGYAWWLMELFWLQLAQLFQAKNVQVWLCFPKLEAVSPALENSGINLIEMEFNLDKRESLQNVASFISENGIGAIYLTDQPFFHWRYFLLRRAGVREIVIHDHTPGDRPPITGAVGLIKSLRNRLSVFTASAVFCISPLMKRRCIDNGRVSVRRCYLVQNGITPLDNSRYNRAEIRQSLNIDNDAVVVISTGRAHPYKRFDFIIETAQAVVTGPDGNNVIFLIAGDGPAFESLQQQVASLNIGNRVRLLGFRGDVHALLEAADMAFHAALGEGFSLSILEYMSSGLPVMVPDIPSVSQSIDHGVTGYIYNKDKTEDAAKYIASLVADCQQRRLMGKNAQETATAHFHLDQCRNQFIAAAKDVYGL